MMKHLHTKLSAFVGLIMIGGAVQSEDLPGDRIDSLSPEQAVVASRMNDFMSSIEILFWKRCDQIDAGLEADPPQVWDIDDNGHYEVRVKRGPVIEKAGVMTVTTRVEQPPFIIGGRWNRFIEVAVHPKSPLVGMLHATFSVQISEAGVGNIGATMDMMQAAQPEEDLELMRSRVTDVFTRHDVDPQRYRPHGCGKPNEGFWKWHRSGTCTGVSLYGQQFIADEETFGLVSDLYTTVVNTYFEILAAREDEAYGPAEVASQEFMRRRWLEDQLFWDVLAKNFVPYEAWSAVNAPPTVRF